METSVWGMYMCLSVRVRADINFTEKKRRYCDGGHAEKLFPVEIWMQSVTMYASVGGQGIKLSLVGVLFPRLYVLLLILFCCVRCRRMCAP